MEDWEANHIDQNKGDLINLTSCHPVFLAELQKEILSPYEVQILMSRDTRIDSAYHLYEIAKTKVGAFDKLVIALQNTKQTGALKILLEGYSKNGKTGPISTKESSQADWNIPEGILTKEQIAKMTIDKGSKETLEILRNLLVTCGYQEEADSLMVKKGILFAAFKAADKQFTLEELVGKNNQNEIFTALRDLLQNSKPEEFVELISEHVLPTKIPDYYIQRKLCSRTKLSYDVFNHHSTKHHIFVIKGILDTELEAIAKDEPIQRTGEFLKETKFLVRFLVLKQDDHYLKLRQMTNSPIHLLEYRENSFFWIQSSHCLEDIVKFVDTEEHGIKEEEFLQRQSSINRTVCISDTPGSGKSALLGKLANLLMQQANREIVLFFNLQEFLRNRDTNISSTSSASEDIASFASNNGVARLVLKEVLMTGTIQVNLFIDGYDEVDYDKFNDANVFLCQVKTLPNVIIYISSRPHLKSNLESLLQVISYNIKPLSKPEQIDLITKYWQHQHNATESLVDSLASQSYAHVRQLSSRDSRIHIAGTPLLCTMVAELQAREIKVLDSKRKIGTLQLNSAFEIFQSFISAKVKAFPKCVENKRNGHMRKNYINAHIYRAILLLFPNEIGQLEKHLKGQEEVVSDRLCRCGLIHAIRQTTPVFAHRMYAEYLTAEFLINHLNKCSSTIDFVFEKILGEEGVDLIDSPNRPKYYTLKHFTLVYFMDQYLKSYTDYNHIDQSLISSHLSTTNFGNLCAAVAASASENFTNVFELATEIYIQTLKNRRTQRLTTLQTECFKHLPHVVVDKYDDVSLLDKVLNFTNSAFGDELSYHVINPVTQNNYQFSHNAYTFPWIPFCTPLHVAAYHGKLEIVEYITRRYGTNISRLKYVLHVCVHKTIDHEEPQIQKKLQIIETMVKQNENWLTEKFEDSGCTPILERRIHLKIVQSLVELNPNIIYSQSQEMENILHRTEDKNAFVKLLEWLVAKEFFELLKQSDSHGWTPLMYAIKTFGELEEGILKLFHKGNADFKVTDRTGYSVLFCALLKSKNTNFLKTILKYGGEINHVSLINKNNAAHVVIEHSRSGSLRSKEVLEVLKFLVENGYNGLHDSNGEGLTPAQYAKRYLDLDDDLTTFFGGKAQVTKADQIDVVLDIKQVHRIVTSSTSYHLLLQNWKMMSRCLQLSEVFVLSLSKKINTGTIEINEVFYELLCAWKAQCGKNATVILLCEALKDCGLIDISETLEETLKTN